MHVSYVCGQRHMLRVLAMPREFLWLESTWWSMELPQKSHRCWAMSGSVPRGIKSLKWKFYFLTKFLWKKVFTYLFILLYFIGTQFSGWKCASKWRFCFFAQFCGKFLFFFSVNLYGIIALIPPSNILLNFMIRFVLVSESLCHVSTKITTFKP